MPDTFDRLLEVPAFPAELIAIFESYARLYEAADCERSLKAPAPEDLDQIEYVARFRGAEIVLYVGAPGAEQLASMRATAFGNLEEAILAHQETVTALGNLILATRESRADALLAQIAAAGDQPEQTEQTEVVAPTG